MRRMFSVRSISTLVFWVVVCCAILRTEKAEAQGYLAVGLREAVALPEGVEAVWKTEKAVRDITATREKICINGLWRWQPAEVGAEKAPSKEWGYFKVPGSWPGITDYMQKDSQTVFAHPAWKDRPLRSVTAAWYEREIEIPGDGPGQRIMLSAEYLNSHATVFLDGEKIGELKFPGGELELHAPGVLHGKHVLSLLVEAMPLKAVLLSYNDTAAARETKGNVARRGLCGDVYLVSVPKHLGRITDVKVDTSVRKSEATFDVALEGLTPEALKEAGIGFTYQLVAQVRGDATYAREFRSPPFQAKDLQEGRFKFTQPWKPEKLWDLHTPQNQCQLQVTLESQYHRRPVDTTFVENFGFREFWIDGKDFYLNGSRIHLSAVPLDNAQCGAAWANYEAAAESMRRLKSFGVNFVYTHNYGCQPGDHLSFDEILRAADDVGMLVALSQPHFSHYDWQAGDADEKNGYARHAEFYVRQAQNHPAVVAYSMSHNACGYSEDMNPEMIDGIHDPRTSSGELNNVRRALRAEAIVKRMDPSRVVYHHAGGNIGAMHTMNFYPNWVPIQEMSDWYEHWAKEGVKPAFMCEYGAPFSWDWGMYRGWYKGVREFGSARVPWDFSVAEWNAQFYGDEAYRLKDYAKEDIRFEAKQLAAGKVWQRWDYRHGLNSKDYDERYPIIAQYLTDNWRAYRTWGVSAISAWEHGMYWKLKEGVDRGRKELPVDWQKLQRPGLSPDYTHQRYERMDLAYERVDWETTPAAEALLRNNRPLLGYIAGKEGAFTSKDHVFYPGQTVEKQLMVINDSRESVNCSCDWSIDLPKPVRGVEKFIVGAGEQAKVPLNIHLPHDLSPGKHVLKASFRFSSMNGEPAAQDDSFTIEVLPPVPRAERKIKIASYDPVGHNYQWLAQKGFDPHQVPSNENWSRYDLLVIGKGALRYGLPINLERVRDGLKVIVFEQTAEDLEKRLGFRVQEYGLRQVFQRIPDHPALAGIKEEHLHDWRGEATLVPPRLKYESKPRLGPTVEWCGMSVPRLWRCGNRGNVASVLIEKPACGDFLPILDGGFSLQYSSLMEYREGKGLILFCQLDVTGRTENDPAADTITRNILQYVADWKPQPKRKAMYVGSTEGKTHLGAAGIDVMPFDAQRLAADYALFVGPGSGEQLAKNEVAIASWLKSGGRILAVGLDEKDLAALPSKVTTRRAEHIASYFAAPAQESPFAGLSPAEVHNRDPRQMPLIETGAAVLGDGVLAATEDGRTLFCQLAPWMYGGSDQPHLKKTFRRTSVLVSRLAANCDVAMRTPLLDRFATPVKADEKRWLEGFYLDKPEEWDDPYRHFRW